MYNDNSEIDPEIHRDDLTAFEGSPSPTAQVEGPPPPSPAETFPTKSPGRVAAGKKGGEAIKKQSVIIKQLMIYYTCTYMIARSRFYKLRDSGELQEVLDQIAEGAVSETQLCPKCSSDMVKRSGKLGLFWGCANYPDCRGTRPIKSEIEKITNEQREISARNLKTAMDYIDTIGGLDEARRWLAIAAQSLGE